MKKLKFLFTVKDKYTDYQYEAGQEYEFEDARAEEILKARTIVTHEPYAVEVETPVENVEETVESPKEDVTDTNVGSMVVTGENTSDKTDDKTAEKPKRKRKTKKDN